ncbi:hypothetical protein AZO1586I_455, partial [Bathymodiolus thermophilus thioautotrophic gill symbiont]
GHSDFGGKGAPTDGIISKFIQLGMPLPLLKPMAQSRRGVAQIGEAQAHPLMVLYQNLFNWVCLCRS